MPKPDLRDVSLVAVTSHEMRAPLAAIRGFVDLLQRRRAELSEAEIEEFLRVISVQTDRLIRLADDLVTMESLDDDTLTVSHEPILVVPALEQLAHELPGGDRIELRISADAPPSIESDAIRFAQVLTNLLTNAL
ncbi:MAG: sensor histidine kinase, partial [Actinomycetota bacterium]